MSRSVMRAQTMVLKFLRWLFAGISLSVTGVTACRTVPAREPGDPLRSYDPAAVAAGDVRDFAPMYRRMGLVASGPPISFVGSVGFFATSSPDTTLTIVALSLPNRGLTFSHVQGVYEAIYDVSLWLSQDSVAPGRGGSSVPSMRIDRRDTVRVTTLGETNRTDESILFRRVLRLPPGAYTVTYTVRDGTAGREATQQTTMIVPQIVNTPAGLALSSPVVVYNATPRSRLTEVPQYLPAPRASAVFGADRGISVYLEAYGTNLTTPVLCTMRNAHGTAIWGDTVWLAQHEGLAAGTIDLPISAADIGLLTLSMVRPGASDTVRTMISLGFGTDLPLVSFDDMLGYLQYFATPDRINTLRQAPVSERGALWAAFLKATDTIPETPQNEGLQAYFARILDANLRFRSDGADQGWRSDRGAAWVGLGEPDRVYEQDAYGGQLSPFPGRRVRVQIWEYRDLQSRIIFYDETGGEQWRFLPSSASLFRTLMARKLAR